MGDDVVEVECNDSGDSVIEIEIPNKPIPPLIHVEDDEIVLNVMEKKQEPMSAEEFIRKNRLVPGVTNTENNNTISTNVNSPNHWTSDMIKFYNDDWGDEDQFIVEKLQAKMDKSPYLWDISRKDILNSKNKLKRSNVRCWNCKQRGHHFSICPDPPYVPKCFMCGAQGHFEYSCPNSKCLNCGNASREYVLFCYKCRNRVNEVCSRCQLVGHNFVNCSDHWRLFHMTTNTTSVVIPTKNIYKLEKDMWCCNCGRKGHYQTHCLQRKENGGIRDTVPFVVSYELSFNNNYATGKPNELNWKKNKDRMKEELRLKKNLRVNPVYKVIRKEKQAKKGLNRIRKNKRRRKRNQDLKINGFMPQ